MDFNLRCENLKSEVIKIINKSELPIAVIYYIFQSIYTVIDNTYFGTINSVRLSQQKKSIEKLKQDVVEKTKQIKKEQKVLDLPSSSEEQEK